MKDAIGGLGNITLLFFFVTLVSGFILFGMNYYRAFSVKNYIITQIEAYEGNLNNPALTSQDGKIVSYMKRMGYNVDIDGENTDSAGIKWHCENGWCWAYDKENSEKYSANKGKCTITYDIYLVKTFVNGDAPFINNSFFSFGKIFHVNGETKPIKRMSGECL